MRTCNQTDKNRTFKLSAKRQAFLFVLPAAFLLCLLLGTLGKFQLNGAEKRHKAFAQSYTHLRLRRALADNATPPVESEWNQTSKNSTEWSLIEDTTLADREWSTTAAPPRENSSGAPTGGECLVPSIDDFPRDLFSDEALANGAIAIHIIAATYLCYALAVVCDIYFVPALEYISEGMHLPSNIAGATFMAAGTSCPELFTSIIGVFVTEGDIGVGTIVGSAVFNNVAVISFSGLLAGMVVPIDWWPLTRDCGYYILTVCALIVVLIDGYVYWYEGAVLVVMFGFYILLMYFNNAAESATKSLVNKCKSLCCCCGDTSEHKNKEREPLLQNGEAGTSKNHAATGNGHIANGDDEKSKREFGNNNQQHASDQPMSLEVSEDMFSPLTLPDGCVKRLVWFIEWPCNLLFYFTIPDCRKENWRGWFPVTFFVSIVYIGVLTYVTTWMVTVIGYTFGIPDTVMGLTFLAAGTSVPEAYSSVIVCRQGYGNMAISNSVGSNIFDILFCLGLPWLIKAAAFSVDGRVEINSSGLFDTAIALLSTVVFLWGALAINKFRLDKKIGFSCLIVYLLFLAFSSVVELTGIGGNSVPTCPRQN